MWDLKEGNQGSDNIFDVDLQRPLLIVLPTQLAVAGSGYSIDVHINIWKTKGKRDCIQKSFLLPERQRHGRQKHETLPGLYQSSHSSPLDFNSTWRCCILLFIHLFACFCWQWYVYWSCCESLVLYLISRKVPHSLQIYAWSKLPLKVSEKKVLENSAEFTRATPSNPTKFSSYHDNWPYDLTCPTADSIFKWKEYIDNI